MSIENANIFLNKLYQRDSAALAVLPKDVALEGIGADEIASIAKSANAAGWCFSADELREAYLDSLNCDDKELASVAGGEGLFAEGPGGCSENYYVEKCGATWEKGSCCSCTDYKWGDEKDPHHIC